MEGLGTENGESKFTNVCWLTASTSISQESHSYHNSDFLLISVVRVKVRVADN